MADGCVQVAADGTGKKIDNEELNTTLGLVQRQRVRIGGGAAAELGDVRNTTPGSTDYGQVTRNIPSGTQAVSGPLTNTELRAAPVPVSGTFYQVTQPVSGTFWQTTQPVSGPLTDAQLRAVAVPVSGAFFQATQPVSGPLTDTQLRAAAVPVSGTFFQATQPVSGTFWQAVQPVSGPLTDTQLRAVAVPVSGTFWQATQPVSGPLTDAQLRASAVPVSGTVTANAGTGTFSIRALTSADVVTAAQGTAAAASAGWPIRVTDGTTLVNHGDATNAAARTIEAPCTWSQAITGTAAAAATLTQASAGVGLRNFLQGFTVSWNGAAPGATTIQVKDGATLIWESYFGSAATNGTLTVEFTRALRGTAATALTVGTSAGVTSLAAKVSAHGYTGA